MQQQADGNCTVSAALNHSLLCAVMTEHIKQTMMHYLRMKRPDRQSRVRTFFAERNLYKGVKMDDEKQRAEQAI